MTTTLTATYDGRALIPTEPLDLPKGATLRLSVEMPASGTRPLQSLAELVQSLPASSGPLTDGAAQHDHYLYGGPRKP